MLNGHSDLPVIEELHRIILSRRDADPAQSNVARLFSRGRNQIAQKFGEEAIELVIEGAHGDRDGIIAELVDVLFHLMVLWASADVVPEEVWAAIRAREGIATTADARPREQARM